MFEKLTACEELVMKVVWDAKEELGLTEISQKVEEMYHKGWKPQTVSTFLARLIRKGYLQSYRQGRVFYYQILIPFEEYRVQITREFNNFWYHGEGGVNAMQDVKAVLEALVGMCESQEKCTACPLYDSNESDTACMLVNGKRNSLAENIKMALKLFHTEY